MTMSILFFQSCESEELKEVNIDPELIPFFTVFEEEAVSRGWENLDLLSQVEGTITNIPGFGISGQCAHNTDAPSLVSIDANYWSRADDYEKEFIVFHELGHCALKRGHDDSKDIDGNCASIMHSSSNVCNLRYDDSTRSDYLDELFQ